MSRCVAWTGGFQESDGFDGEEGTESEVPIDTNRSAQKLNFGKPSSLVAACEIELVRTALRVGQFRSVARRGHSGTGEKQGRHGADKRIANHGCFSRDVRLVEKGSTCAVCHRISIPFRLDEKF